MKIRRLNYSASKESIQSLLVRFGSQPNIIFSINYIIRNIYN